MLFLIKAKSQFITKDGTYLPLRYNAKPSYYQESQIEVLGQHKTMSKKDNVISSKDKEDYLAQKSAKGQPVS